MNVDRQHERDVIIAATQRLLAGCPQRSTGALTVLQLAAEADVKRWVLTHKHPDLKAEFERQRAAANGIPTAYQSLAAKVTDLEAANRRLRTENSELRQRVDTYAQVIYRVGMQLNHERATPSAAGNVHQLQQPR